MIKLDNDCKANNPTNHPARSCTAARNEEATAAAAVVVAVFHRDVLAVVLVMDALRIFERGEDDKDMAWAVVVVVVVIVTLWSRGG